MQKILSLMLTLLPAVALSQEGVNPRTLGEFRLERLNGYASVLVDWAAETADFTPEQKTVLVKLLQVEVQRVQRIWNSQRIPGDDFQLTYFASSPGGAGRDLPLIHKTPGLARALTVGHLDVLRDAVRERGACHEDLSADAYIGVLTKMLYLDAQEQIAVRDLLKTRYRLPMLNGAPTRSNLQDLKLLNDDTLEQLVGKRMDSLRFHIYEKLDVPVDLTVTLEIPPTSLGGGSESGLEQHITAAIRRSCQKFENRYKVGMRGRIRDMAVRNGLTDQQVRRLELAAAGIRKRKMQKWMQEGRESLPPVAQIARHLDVGLWETETRLSPIKLGEEKLWINAVTKVNEENTRPVDGQKPAAMAAIRHGLVSQTMQWLDHELWLRPKQREPVRKLIDQAVTELYNNEPTDHLKLVFRAAVQNMPSAKLEKLLTTEQRKAWRRIQKLNALVAIVFTE